MYLNTEETIVACSSGGNTNAAIAIIRISGFNYLKKLQNFFSLNLNSIKDRYAYFCKFLHDEAVVDEVVFTFFPGPRSYNGEDILEISVHGNVININRIINLLCTVKNFRKAMPGEFSFRALKNNKLNLSQVEGLDLLLNANSIFSLNQGLSLISGKLQKDFHDLYTNFLNHKSAMEFGFDFLEDMGEEQFKEQFNITFKALESNILSLFNTVNNQNFNLIKPEITIFGPPNAGKSTLFNILLQEERAITSRVAGTTRDFIREDLWLNEKVFSLIDTAGIRLSVDEIESEGVTRALDIIKTSFFKILLVNPYEIEDEFYKNISNIDFDLVIFTHSDRLNYISQLSKALSSLELGVDVIDIGPIEPINSGPIEPTNSGPIEPINSGPIEPTNSGPIEPTNSGPIEPINSGPIEPINSGPIEPTNSGPIEPTNSGPIEPRYCSLTEGPDTIREYIQSKSEIKYLELIGDNPVLIQRHADSIKKIYSSFKNYKMTVDAEQDLAIVASELNILGHCISELIGIVSPNDVLHNIFDNFCIGK